MLNVIEQVIEDKFAIYNGDCVEVMKGVPTDSVHYEIFSPPFEGLYVYSNNERDMGNSKNSGEFREHYKFLIKEQYRTLMPGRLLSFHCIGRAHV